MNGEPYKFLFLCTGNSARSIIGEFLLRHLDGSRFQVFSAGSFPTGKVNPFAIQVLKDIYDIDASQARSKSWQEFESVQFDFVVTVCDNARETCPVCRGNQSWRIGVVRIRQQWRELTQKSIAPSRKWLPRLINGFNFSRRFHWIQ